nr:trypsin-like [Onthophagus taurus]
MLLITFLISLLFQNISGQLTTALPYVCVPIGTCTTPTSSPNVIDPRIVTPTTSPCPAGQEACFITSPTGQCGRRYVQNVNTADGAATLGAFPWLAYITNQTGYTGVGVLINPQTVLTAAHKVCLNEQTPSNVRVSLGVYSPSNMATAQNSTASSIAIHPNFNCAQPWTLINDIAVIRLSTPISIGIQTNVGTACLPPAAAPGTSPYVGRSCTVAGWGQTGFGTNDAPTNPQKQVTVPIVTYQECRASMSRADLLGSAVDRFLDPNGEICAGGLAQRDACTQDGGAPLVCADTTTGQFYIAGLVIWGKRCGLPGVYGVYVNVPVYRQWIDTVIASFG